MIYTKIFCTAMLLAYGNAMFGMNPLNDTTTAKLPSGNVTVQQDDKVSINIGPLSTGINVSNGIFKRLDHNSKGNVQTAVIEIKVPLNSIAIQEDVDKIKLQQIKMKYPVGTLVETCGVSAPKYNRRFLFVFAHKIRESDSTTCVILKNRSTKENILISVPASKIKCVDISSVFMKSRKIVFECNWNTHFQYDYCGPTIGDIQYVRDEMVTILFNKRTFSKQLSEVKFLAGTEFTKLVKAQRERNDLMKLMKDAKSRRENAYSNSWNRWRNSGSTHYHGYQIEQSEEPKVNLPEDIQTFKNMCGNPLTPTEIIEQKFTKLSIKYLKNKKLLNKIKEYHNESPKIKKGYRFHIPY